MLRRDSAVAQRIQMDFDVVVYEGENKSSR
jgi:hypothetical protein